MSDKPKITTKKLGYHRFVLTINGHEIGPERSSASSLQEVWAWIDELPFAEVMPMLSNVAEHAADEEAGKVDISVTQEEVAEWAGRNFGETAPYRPLLGMCEELGEICATFWNLAQADDGAHLIIRAMAHLGKIAHSQLKAEQGIRGTVEEHRQTAIDERQALDNTLYMLFDHRPNSGGKGIPLRNFEKTDTVTDGLGDLFVYACHFSALMGITLEEAIFTTWAKVKLRDWQKNNQNGGETPIAEIQRVQDVVKELGVPLSQIYTGEPTTTANDDGTYTHKFTSPE